MNSGAVSIDFFVDGDNHIAATSVIPLGGDNITKDLSVGMRSSIEEAEMIKQKHGFGYYPDANEDETFKVSVIGSENKKVFNQLEISDIIEDRLEEIYMFVRSEIQRMDFYDLLGGYVFKV